MIKHGMTKTKLYNIWQDMKYRCYYSKNNRYSNYGGRGIKVCDEWLGSNGFINFYNWAIDNGWNEEVLTNGRSKLTIERKDVNGNYCPENCCFATMKEQANNKTNNRAITYNGKTQNLNQWANELGISRELISHRISKLNWSIEKALTTPVNNNIYFTYNGETLTLSQWAEKLNIRHDTLYSRINTYNWSIEKAFTTAINIKCRKKG